jgi:hypothetical protein
MAFRNLGSGWPSSGAGYDDRNNNSDGRKVAGWKAIEHRRTKGQFNVEVP